MMLYNTMKRGEEQFISRQRGEVKIFTCGPSIYRRPHIGNYRTFLYEDALVRYLEYCGYRVERIINFTDVEDKAIAEARELGKDIQEVTGSAARYFYRETEELSIKLPPTVPSSTTSVFEAVMIIKTLLDKKVAYWFKGDVFFNPLKYKDFGKLFRLDMSRWPQQPVHFKKDTYNGRRWNRGDFILWHGYKDGDVVFWETELGKGRPSWNIQDPAMIVKHLGLQIDINCGGIDNIYRHHDYNIAVMESYTGQDFANYYLHGEHLWVDSQVMSKSRGNILYPADIYQKSFGTGELRYFLLERHYRRKLNFTFARLAAQAAYLRLVKQTIRSLLERGRPQDKAFSALQAEHHRRGGGGAKLQALPPALVLAALTADFRTCMDNDLAVGEAIKVTVKNILSIGAAACTTRLSPDQKKQLHAVLTQLDSVFCFLL